jgi:hypothetical protein
VLRVELLALDDDVEDAVVALDELDLDVLLAEPRLELGDQTGRLGLVVSTRAVGDLDLHARLLITRNYP